jgi:hypothetical protein
MTVQTSLEVPKGITSKSNRKMKEKIRLRPNESSQISSDITISQAISSKSQGARRATAYLNGHSVDLRQQRKP